MEGERLLPDFGASDRLGEIAEDVAALRSRIECSVDGQAQEDLLCEHKPIFIVLESLVALSLWLYFAVSDGRHWNSIEGLDSVFSKDESTLLAVHSDCKDLRWQLWRWYSYQFSHVGFTHVGSNVFTTLVVGVPLEGFQGSLRACLVFNLGVLGAACAHVVVCPHEKLAGMSGGCFALIGFHCAELAATWKHQRLRLLKLMILVLLVLSMALEVELNRLLRVDGRGDHSAHLGGFAAGVLAGGSVGRSFGGGSDQEQRFALAGTSCCALLGLVCLLVSVCWVAQWPPRSCWDPSHPWCWARQVLNMTFFDDNHWHCARCFSQACIDGWARSDTAPMPVSATQCDVLYGWGSTEP